MPSAAKALMFDDYFREYIFSFSPKSGPAPLAAFLAASFIEINLNLVGVLQFRDDLCQAARLKSSSRVGAKDG